ncbi:nicotinamide mononucleotide transporter [Flavihumibacter sp. R14]|nr:nicotinamide mononucleotide transporter [Flavihumibacter soli]
MLLQLSFWELIINQLAATTWLEWVGTLSGFACVYLAARQNIWNWPVAIISVVAYSILFFEYRLYGDAALQIYFMGTSIYGWYYWLRRKELHQKPVVRLEGRGFAIVSIAGIVLTLLLGWFLDNYTDTNVPYADGFCTAISFIAQFLMTRKVLQNWILWILVDICYVPLYLYKDLMLTAVLYTLFLGLAVLGYLQWRKSYQLSVEIASKA